MAAALRAAPEPVVYAVPGSPLVAERTRRPAARRRPGGGDRRPGPLLPGPGLGGARHRSAGRRGAPGRRQRRRPRGRARGRPVPGGPVLVAAPALRGEAGRSPTTMAWSCHGRCSCTTSASRTRWWWRSTGGSSTARWSPTTSRPSTSRPPSPPTAAPPATRWPSWSRSMDTLRERCPWDSVQTHASLMPHLVEESYEVLDALAGLAAAEARRRRRRLRTPGGGAGRPALPDRLPRPPGRRGRAVRPGRRGAPGARQARPPPPARLRRRRRRHGRTGRHELGGDQEEREGPPQRDGGHPGRPPGADAHDQAGAQGARRRPGAGRRAVQSRRRRRWPR